MTALPEHCDCCPELSLDGDAGARLTSLSSTGLENTIGRLGGGTAAFSMVLCVFVSPRHSHTYSQPAVQGVPPSPGLCLPSYGQVQKTAAEENQIMNKHSELTLNVCSW